jgi:L-asparaginase
MKKILIINTGGTFNKQYDELSGKLFVLQNNDNINNILKSSKIDDIKIKGILYKDSLDIKKSDRKELVKMILKSEYNNIIIIHGTDTMNKTASFLNKKIKNKSIVLTGSMIPYLINSAEAISNLMSAYGFLQNKTKNGIYIAMHGHIQKNKKIKKNYAKGIFECQ